jgi:hypothetical protein
VFHEAGKTQPAELRDLPGYHAASEILFKKADDRMPLADASGILMASRVKGNRILQFCQRGIQGRV